MVDIRETHEALCLLRDAPPSGRAYANQAWGVVVRSVHEIVHQQRVSPPTEREDTAQLACLKVFNSVDSLEGPTPEASVAWLKRVVRHTALDRLRAAKGRQKGLVLLTAYETLEADATIIEAQRGEHLPLTRDPEELARCEEALKDLLGDYVNAHKKAQHRAQATRKALLAYRHVVKGESLDAIERDTGDVSRDTLYQWLHRGRTDVLKPAIEAWLGDLSPDSYEYNFAAHILETLESACRSDAGRPRPDSRKKSEPAVRLNPPCASAQYDDDEAGDD